MRLIKIKNDCTKALSPARCRARRTYRQRNHWVQRAPLFRLNIQLNRLVVHVPAVMACCLGEAGHEKLQAVFTSDVPMLMSAPPQLDLGIVAANRNIQQTVNEALLAYQVRIEPFTHHQAILAIAAFTQFDESRYPAEPNSGDCCAYAQAKSMNSPLLYKGNDFAQTDIASALA